MESIILKLCRGGYVDSVKKSEMLRVLSSEISMPWCGVSLEGCCENIKRNNGLYTQCENVKVIGLLYCKECEKQNGKNGGESKNGKVSDRLKSGIMEYIDPSSGKKPIIYREYMRKMNITRSEVESYGKLCGVVIPECHFDEGEEKKKRGRPKSEKEEKPLEEKKKRGRPKKEKEVICNAGEELIASLLTESRESSKSEEKKNMEIEVEKKMESEVEKKMESEVEKKMESEVEKNMESDVEKNMEIEDEEETLVVKFDIKGVIYLKSSDNVLYDMMSHDVIGIWNEETSEIDEIPDEYEEEE
jgi:hypothetical protein